MLVSATADDAVEALDNIKSHLSHNDMLLEDYPEAVFPIRQLEGEARRCTGQRYYGKLTHIEWSANQIVMPTIPGSRCSGALVRTAGITGKVRGAMYVRPDGQSVRPTIVIIDDPQTDQSARSAEQVNTRKKVVNGAILNLAGPGKKIAAVMPCTVICRDDLADQLLDRRRNPEWQGERTKFLYSFPSNEKLWSQYEEMRDLELESGGDGSNATEFYRANQAAMDDGAKVAWTSRFNVGELSAIQHAMNLRFRDEVSFFAEYQNEPLSDFTSDDDILTAEQIAAKVNGFDRGVCSIGVSHVTAFIDVQGDALFWMACGWEDNFNGYILDYGAYPQQSENYFSLADIRRTLKMAHPGAGPEGAIFAGLEALSGSLCNRKFRRDDSIELSVSRLMIDANWNSDVIYSFVRQSKNSGLTMPSHGKFVGASSVPWSDYKPKLGERSGLHWRIPILAGNRPVRHTIIDTNYWKTFVHARLAVPIGDAGCLSLFRPERGRSHEMVSDHLTAEYKVKTMARGREVDEWKEKPHREDNHFFDCLVGCAVGASMQGCSIGSLPGSKARREARPRRSMADKTVWER